MALAAGFTGQVREAVEVGAARLAEVRRRGALGVLVPTLAILAGGRAWLGDHVGAFADAGEAADLAEHLGYAADASVAVEMLAWQQAARGLHDDARASLDRARVLTDRAGTTAAAAHQALTAAFCALCRGDLAGVVGGWSRASPSTAGSVPPGSRSASRRCWSRRTSGWAGSTTRGH